MNFGFTCRALLIGSLMLAAAAPVMAQDKPVLRFSAVFSEQDIRAEMMNKLSAGVADIATIEPYFGGNLFKQGTELVALQRGNLEMGNIAPQDISNQIPAWSVLTSAYLFRDADHLRTFFDSDVGAEFKKMAEDQLGIHILGPTYFGARQVGLTTDKEIKTPADMAGIKLRMPGGDAWQFLGTALGANPTPMAYAEVYTGLQTGEKATIGVRPEMILPGAAARQSPDQVSLAATLRRSEHLGSEKILHFDVPSLPGTSVTSRIGAGVPDAEVENTELLFNPSACHVFDAAGNRVDAQSQGASSAAPKGKLRLAEGARAS